MNSLGGVRSRNKPLEIEGARQDWIVLQPLAQQGVGDIDFAGVAENARVDTRVNDRKRIADDKLVRRQATVAFAFRCAGNDSADRMEVSCVGDELQFGSHGVELF